MKKYIVNSKSIIKLFSDTILYTNILIIWICFLYYNINYDIRLFSIVLFVTLVIYLTTVLMPTLYLYNNYYSFNEKTILVLEKDRIIYNEVVINLKEINSININATYQYFNGKTAGVTSLAYNPYFYYIEIIMNNKKYYLTSLLGFSLGDDMREYYPSIEYREIVMWYPIIKKEN